MTGKVAVFGTLIIHLIQIVYVYSYIVKCPKQNTLKSKVKIIIETNKSSMI